MYDANAFTSSSSSVGGGDHRSPDDISLFLNQILHRSPLYSSVSLPTTPFSSAFAAPLESYPNSSKCGSALVDERIYCLHSGNGANVGNFSGNGGGNTPAFSIGGVSENETDEYDCESEEGLEVAKTTATRSSSKRSRAAEVHNLSEKRRRSRINEKMKALQNLIPNSNKTDKASMLDDAIEYLKQLQLQVQMLSMRNGISLHPVCLPRLFQPFQHSQFIKGFPEENRSHQMNIIESIPLNQGNAEQTLYNLPNQCTVSNQLPLPNMPTILYSETSSVRAHLNHPFPLPATSGEIGRESSLPRQHLNTDHTSWICGRDQSECVFSKNIEYNVVLPTSLQG